MKIKFDKYYSGEWNYDLRLGVGLSFFGVPSDYRKFLDILHGVSCNPVSARRILGILESGERKYVTVMSKLNFNEIGDNLKTVGVEMRIEIPYDYKNENEISDNSLVDSQVLSEILKKDSNIEGLENNLKELFKERLLDFKDSIEKRPHNFGLYDR